MTQIIKFDDLRHKRPMDIIFIRACLAAGDIEPTTDGNYALEFTVQGKTVDFEKFCKSFEEHYDEEIMEAAERKLKELADLTQLRDKLDEVRDAAVEKMDEILAFFRGEKKS